MRRNLVIVRAGDTSLHTGWLGHPEQRNWDIVVNYYGDEPHVFRDLGQVRHDSKGPKWPALHKLMNQIGEEVVTYDYIWFPDDDLAADCTCINRFFDICHEFRLELAQPSLSYDSIVNHILTLTNKSFRLRTTNFVEIMAPCFSRDFFKRCSPSFGTNASGWGLDFLWPNWASAGKTAIIDDVTVRHTRTRGPQYAMVKSEGKMPEQEMAELIAREGLTTTLRVTGGLTRDGQVLSFPADSKKLVELLLAGYLPELANYPQHIFKVIEPLLNAGCN